MRRWPFHTWLLCFFLLCLECATPPPPATPPATPPASLGVSVGIAEVSAMQEDAGWQFRLRWRDGIAIPPTGSLFSILDTAGYKCQVKLLGLSSTDCDHCPGPLLDLQVVEGRCPTSSSLALGPTALPLRDASYARKDTEPFPKNWETSLVIDLNGDSKYELMQAIVCDQWLPSGCADQACARICTGLRDTPTSAPRASSISCHAFVPDLDDCLRPSSPDMPSKPQ